MTERDDLDASRAGHTRRLYNSGWRESGVMVETLIFNRFFHAMISRR